jgi:zinc protease
MARGRRAAAGVLALLAVLGGDARGAGRAPAATEVVLPNGMTVVLAPDHTAPVVGLELRYLVGSGDDPPGRPGLSVLTQRLMVRATTHLAEGEYDRRLDAAGGYDSEWHTGFDRTVFRVTVPAEELALPLWLWSDQMGFFADRLDAALVRQQLAVARNERVQRIDNIPAGRVGELARAHLYPPGHPYHAGELPGTAALEGISPDEVRAFFDSHYRPQRAVLALSGDFDPTHALDIVTRYFGTFHAGGAVRLAEAGPPLLAGETRLRVAARVEMASVLVAWSTPAYRRPGDAELDLIAELLAGRRVGWLRLKLVDEMKIAASVSARQVSLQRGSEFVIHASATPGHTADELVRAIDQVLARLQARPPERFSTMGAIAGYLIDKVFDLEQSRVRADRYADCGEGEGATVDDCARAWVSQYVRLPPEQLSRVAAEQLPLGRRVVVEVIPSATAPLAGELVDTQAGIE